MKASELAAKLLELAKVHGDPHVYAYPQNGECVQAIEPQAVTCVHPGGIEPMVMIVGVRFSESPAVQALLAKAE